MQALRATRPPASLPLALRRGRWWQGELGANSSKACRPCGVGLYQPEVGQVGSTSCLPCAAGNHSGRVGSAACRSCSPGRYSELLGSSSCSFCKVRRAFLELLAPGGLEPPGGSCAFQHVQRLHDGMRRRLDLDDKNRI